VKYLWRGTAGDLFSAPQDEEEKFANMIEQGIWGVHNFSNTPCYLFFVFLDFLLRMHVLFCDKLLDLIGENKNET